MNGCLGQKIIFLSTPGTIYHNELYQACREPPHPLACGRAFFHEDEEAVATHKEAATLWLLADLTMMLDTMLTVSAASQGNFFLPLSKLGSFPSYSPAIS